MLSDVAANVVQQVTELTELSYVALFHINLMVNIICIVMSFNKWKDIVFFSRLVLISCGGCGTFSRKALFVLIA